MESPSSFTNTVLEEIQNLISADQLAELEAIDDEFKASSDSTTKNDCAVRYCEEICRDGQWLEIKAYAIYRLIKLHCGLQALVLISEKGCHLRKRSEAWQKRGPCLDNLIATWGVEIVKSCGLMTARYERLRWASSGCRQNRNWGKEACPKLNQLLINGALNFHGELETQYWKHLSRWIGQGIYELNSRRLKCEALPDGYSYNLHGLVLAPLRLGAFIAEPEVSPLPGAPSKSPPDQRAPSANSGSVVLHDTIHRSKSSLHKPIGDASDQHQHLTDRTISLRPTKKSYQRPLDDLNVVPGPIQAHKRSKHAQLRTKIHSTRQCSSRHVQDFCSRDSRSHDPESCSEIEWTQQTQSDDCVTNVLLDVICQSSKYNASFQTMTAVEIRPKTKMVAEITSWIIEARKHDGLDSPKFDHLHDQLSMYLNTLSHDCPFDFGTIRYAEHEEEWCLVAREKIKRDSVIKYLYGKHVTITEGMEGPLNNLGRITWPDGEESIVIGPPRFAGHDCNFNAELKRSGDLVIVVAQRDIGKDEEITVNYGNQFFNNSDRDCACTTCRLQEPDRSEDWQRRYWPPRYEGRLSPSYPSGRQRQRQRDTCKAMAESRYFDRARDDSAYRVEALISLDQQRQVKSTNQARDAKQLHHLLSLARKPRTMGWEDGLDDLSCELIVTDRTKRFDIPLIPIIIEDYGIPAGCPNSMQSFTQAMLKALGSTVEKQRKYLDIQLKSASIGYTIEKGEEVELSSLRQRTIEDFCAHMSSGHVPEETWNVLDIGTSFLPHADSWRPDAFCQNDLLTEIRGRLQLSGKRGQAFELKQSWILAGDPRANSILHFDSHGLSTFLLVLVGPVLIVYSTTKVTDKKEKEDFYRYMRSWTTSRPAANVSSTMEEHLRYVVLYPGQMWFMLAGRLHAVVREARTLIYGGHCIPMEFLPEWLLSVEDSLRHYDSTNEDPVQLLDYIECACQAVTQRQTMGELEEIGGPEQVEKFWVHLTSLLRQPAARLFHGSYPRDNAVRQAWNQWTKEMRKRWKGYLKF